ncbi:DNA polymerase sliding clamp [Stygiolobus caldivivus]|uniref:DNA polymerase sliding clamp n=1 Tax=Stygiolobus caldivivus TaxID=2824673 RepID=A0A8D5U776_9CREN|nr:DNA polymerase sliding clamp [Stygiolobus caldivivus]BCU70238.1 DNA polymerase III sliding clamp [Stygiolobus caldivivus]
MKIKVVDAVNFSFIFKTLTEFMEETTLQLDQDGLKIKGIDPSRTVLIDVLIPSGYFETYEIEGETKVGVKLEDIANILDTATKNDSVSIDIEQDKVLFQLDGEYERTFTLPVFSSADAEIPEIKLEFPFKATMLTATFADLVDELEETGSDIMKFKSEEGKLLIIVEGDLASASIELSKDNGGLMDSEGSDAESTYSVEFIANTTKMRKPSDTVNIEFGTQLPLKLRYNLPQGGYADFYISPRAE